MSPCFYYFIRNFSIFWLKYSLDILQAQKYCAKIIVLKLVRTYSNKNKGVIKLEEKKKKKESVYKRLMPYAGGKGYMLYLAMFLSAVSGIMILMPMVCIHRIVSQIILEGRIAADMVKENVTLAVISAIGGMVAYLLAIVFSHIFAFEVEDNIIKVNMKRLMDKPLGFFSNRESGKLRNVIISGAGETHSFLAHQLPDVAMTIISPLVLLVFFFVFDWRLGLASLLPMTAGFILMGTMMTKEAQKAKDDYYKSLANLSSETVEYVRGIPVVKTFAQSVESFDRLYSLIMKMKDIVIKMTLGYRTKMAIFEAVATSTAFFLVPVAILIINNGGDIRVVLGNSVIYLLIGPAFGTFIFRTAAIGQYKYFAETALNRIDDILDYKVLSYGQEVNGDGELEFKNVSFSYGKEKVLDNISFKVNKGETVALVGSSGGGKTTIARLAARFYDADEGEVLIGGINIKNYDKKSLMNKIAFVFQNSKLFKMSLRENLLLGNENASETEIEAALINSGSKEIVDNLENGLDTVYGTKGTYFSGGEAQRLAIARAFLKNAKFIVLDEATAFADPENEHIIQESFKKLSKDKTTLMIAHRLSTVVDADKILVIDGGKIAESGKHEELLAKNGVYKKLWEEYQRSVNWKLGGKNE